MVNFLWIIIPLLGGIAFLIVSGWLKIGQGTEDLTYRLRFNRFIKHPDGRTTTIVKDWTNENGLTCFQLNEYPAPLIVEYEHDVIVPRGAEMGEYYYLCRYNANGSLTDWTDPAVKRLFDELEEKRTKKNEQQQLKIQKIVVDNTEFDTAERLRERLSVLKYDEVRYQKKMPVPTKKGELKKGNEVNPNA